MAFMFSFSGFLFRENLAPISRLLFYSMSARVADCQAGNSPSRDVNT